MARHWAEIDPNTNKVLRVILCDDFNWIVDNLGGTWVETFNPNEQKAGSSPVAEARKNCAGIGYTWNREIDGFVPPCKYPSWGLNPDTALKEAPAPKPVIDKQTQACCWDEKNLQYVVCALKDWDQTQKALDDAAAVTTGSASAEIGGF